MTSHSPTLRTPAPVSEPTPRFAIGQSVRLRSGYGNPARPINEVYRVTGMLPATDVSFQYRLRRDSDPFDRVATEQSLDVVTVEEPVEGTSSPQSVFRT